MDRVSSLPDELLCRVLSFLTTKEAALTSVLAKRWRDLFAFVPNLDLDDSVFLHPEEGKGERDRGLQSFIDFADRVLALQGDSPIKKLTLTVLNSADSNRVNRWIRNVLHRGVSDLLIDLGAEYRLPPEIFVSRTLVKLRVFHGFDLDWHVLGISLPMLKYLHLGSVGFCVDQFEMLLPACPALDTLFMTYIKWKNSNVTVSSTSLKKLCMVSNGCSDHFLNPKSISFDTPSLVGFLYHDSVAEDYPKVNLPNLVEANVQQPQNVKYLELENRGWQAMPVLLKNCPHLELLVFDGLLHHVTDKCGDACDCISREDKGRSLTSCRVKKLHIKGFRGTLRELGIIKHFLLSFPCLEVMRIFAEEESPTDFEIPGVFKIVEEMLNLYDDLSSCDVKLVMPSDTLYKKWTAQ